MEKLSKLSDYKLTLIYALRDLSRNYKKISSIILTLFISLFILSSIFLSVTQPAVGLSFKNHMAGKALTSFNLLIFLGTFIMQWVMGLVIDLVKNFGYTEIIGFKSAFSVFLFLSIISYIFFLIINRKS